MAQAGRHTATLCVPERAAALLRHTHTSCSPDALGGSTAACRRSMGSKPCGQRHHMVDIYTSRQTCSEALRRNIRLAGNSCCGSGWVLSRRVASLPPPPLRRATRCPCCFSADPPQVRPKACSAAPHCSRSVS